MAKNVARVLTMVVAALTFCGCARTVRAVAESPVQSGPTSVATSEPELLLGCHPPSLANCFTEATMLDYATTVRPMVEEFFTSTYEGIAPPTDYRFVEEGTTVRSECGAQDDTAYAYCPADGNIFLGQRQMWAFYTEDGDAAAVIGLAHEWGHHLQTVMGVPDPTGQADKINHEDQADCVAGAWIKYAIAQNWFERQDLASTDKLLNAIASAEDDPDRDHGVLAERAASMGLGITGGLPACNSFYPATPVVTAA